MVKKKKMKKKFLKIKYFMKQLNHKKDNLKLKLLEEDILLRMVKKKKLKKSYQMKILYIKQLNQEEEDSLKQKLLERQLLMVKKKMKIYLEMNWQ